jgi:aldehyde:ferredoxin oxidoreductase
MSGSEVAAGRDLTDFSFDRYHVDLTAGTVRHEHARCADLEDALGGIARAYKLLSGLPVTDPYDPSAPLVVNIGLLTGTRVMTGLRTYLTGLSPLKASLSGAAGVMWSAGSGSFGPKLRGLGVDEIVLTGRAPQPTLLHLSPGTEGRPARFAFLDASDLTGLGVNARVQSLHGRFPGAQFAVIGPAGEHFGEVAYAAVALSTDGQLESGDCKPRYCGRGGFGGVLGSKNLVAVAADGPNPQGSSAGLKEVNREINLGPGSARYRDLPHDKGGTWRTFHVLHEVGALPEMNFAPMGTDDSVALYRASLEAGPYVIRAEGCRLCGIRCHRSVYAKQDSGEPGPFRTKVDYEPLSLLSSNLGIFDPGQALALISQADEMGLDAVSAGVTLGYAMEFNRRHPGAPLAGGLSYGDFAATREAIVAIAEGRLPELGQGVRRLSAQTGEISYAMQSKGLEYPAHLPQVNPAYPWALAGGHMSMRTFFLLLNERETGLDYWVDAVTNRGPQIMLDDITGICKLAAITPELEAEAIRAVTGLAVTGDDLRAAVRRTYLRGYAGERSRGFTADDYTMPAEAHLESPHIRLPYFNSPEFFATLKERVTAVLDERLAEAGDL